MLNRRDAILGAMAVASPQPGGAGYGLITRFTARPAARDDLAALLTEAARETSRLPGCQLYLVALAAGSADDLWVTEVWISKAHHDAALATLAAAAMIARARPLIAGIEPIVTRPLPQA